MSFFKIGARTHTHTHTCPMDQSVTTLFAKFQTAPSSPCCVVGNRKSQNPTLQGRWLAHHDSHGVDCSYGTGTIVGLLARQFACCGAGQAAAAAAAGRGGSWMGSDKISPLHPKPGLHVAGGGPMHPEHDGHRDGGGWLRDVLRRVKMSCCVVH